jgi:hypothetical protein
VTAASNSIEKFVQSRGKTSIEKFVESLGKNPRGEYVISNTGVLRAIAERRFAVLYVFTEWVSEPDRRERVSRNYATVQPREPAKPRASEHCAG